MEIAEEVLQVASQQSARVGVSAIPVEATLSLTTLILAVFAAIFVTPPMAKAVDFYHGHLKKRCTGWLAQPLRAPLLFGWAFVANTFLALSFIWYAYNESVNAATDDTAAEYYVAVTSLLMVVIALKFIWKLLVWNFHDRTWAMVIAMIGSVAVPLIEFVLIVLMGMRNVWFSMAFMIFVFLINVPLPFWTWVIYNYFAVAPRRSKKRSRRSED